MTRLTNSALAACAAFVLSLASIGALVTVPQVQSQSPASVNAISELA